MNHKLLSSLTASLLIATAGLPITANAQNSEMAAQEADTSAESNTLQVGSSATSEPTNSVKSPVAKLGKQSNEVVKVGEQQSQPATQTSSEAVATVQPHAVSGRDAATLYVRNIPILTFLGNRIATPDGVKLGTQKSPSLDGSSANIKSVSRSAASQVSFNSLFQSSLTLSEPDSSDFKLDALNDSTARNNPVWRASVVAARINQLRRDGIPANSITVSWENQSQDSAQRDRLVIRSNRIAIVTLDGDTLLPDSTRNLEKDALQATNRLRRVLGNATPLQEVAGKPGAIGEPNFAIGAMRLLATGFASWYGPGFHGNQSASGERFNQHALTAAHRTLPFGTRVLVTNLDNGQSVIVRINDRGPFHGNRVIDVSKGAASVLGLISSGVARVRLDVVDPRSAAANN
jgi:rare lipoprotein A